MLIDRADGVINLCEIKYSTDKYEIKKKYAEDLLHKASVFKSKTENKKAVFTVMITTNGLIHNAYAGDIQNEVVAEELFG